MSKVSVILPTYNRATLIGRAVESVLNQTYRDFELIIVDDGSTDDTEKVVKSFSDERIYYTKHKVNKGAAAARNTGLKLAKGELIAFQDSDDEWLPEKLEKQVKVIQTGSPKLGLVYHNMKSFPLNDGSSVTWVPIHITPEDGIVYSHFLSEFIRPEWGIAMQTTVIKKECFNRVGGFDERLRRCIDTDLFIRISKYYYFYHIDEPLVNFSYMVPGGIRTDDMAAIRGQELILNKYNGDLLKNPKALANIHYHLGYWFYLLGEPSKGREYLLEAARINPTNPKYILMAFLGMFGICIFSIAVKSKDQILGRGVPTLTEKEL